MATGVRRAEGRFGWWLPLLLSGCGFFGGSEGTDIDPRSKRVPPSPPTDVTVVSRSSVQIDVGWKSGSDNTASFLLQRRNGDGEFADVAVFNVGVTAYVDWSLNPGAVYGYRIKAMNEYGESGFSSPVLATTFARPSQAPLAPTGLGAVNRATSVELRWNDNAFDETRQVVQRKAPNSGVFSDVATLGADVNGFTDAGLSSLTQYTYRVVARNQVGDTPSAAEVTTTTRAPDGGPGPPADIRKESFVIDDPVDGFWCEVRFTFDPPATDPDRDRVYFEICRDPGPMGPVFCEGKTGILGYPFEDEGPIYGGAVTQLGTAVTFTFTAEVDGKQSPPVSVAAACPPS